MGSSIIHGLHCNENFYAINSFISWELMPIVYGKIRVLNMTKSAKTRTENLGEPYEGQSSSEERSPLQIL